jgi:hypothetical protein
MRRTTNGHGRGASLRTPAPKAATLPKELSRQLISWLFGTSTWPEAGAAFGPLQCGHCEQIYLVYLSKRKASESDKNGSRSLECQASRLDNDIRKQFYSQRVVDRWNKLVPRHTKNSMKVKNFKMAYKKRKGELEAATQRVKIGGRTRWMSSWSQ